MATLLRAHPTLLTPTVRVMRQALLQISLLLLLLGLTFPAAAANELTIGVLALRGPEKVHEMWDATGTYLEHKLPGYTVHIVPLDFDEIHLAVRQRRVDFVLANPSYYVELESLYGVSPVATLKNRIDGGAGYSVFGGVIFTRADRDDIRTIADLKGKTFGAVDKNSFGGWQTGWREMRHQGVNPETQLARVDFLGTHDAVVYAVRDGKVDAGTVRTEVLERMAAEGKIRFTDFLVLNPQRQEGFPLLLSTPLYPEWPIAKLPHVPEHLAVSVAVALMQMPPDSPAAKASHSNGWTLPFNYQSVREALKELRIGPYENMRRLNPQEVLAQYWYWLVIALLLVLIAIGTLTYVGRMNRHLRHSQRELQLLNTTLEERVMERTDRIEHLLDRERYLRGIVEMVADVNEILITATSVDDMLKACCDRLVAHPDYRFAWVGLLQEGHLELAAHSYGTAEFMRNLHACLDGPPCAPSMSGNRTLIENDMSKLPAELSRAGVSSAAALPLRKDAYAVPLGALCVLSSRAEKFDQEEIAMLEQLAGDIGFAIHAFRQQSETIRLQQERISNYEASILSLVDMIDKRDTYTAGHTQRVARYCELIATRLGHSAEEIEKLKRAATLHDIGKIAIPDSVLLKPGTLSQAEYDLIKQHIDVGYDTLSRIDMYKDLADIMRHHHERLDGSGYPAGLRDGEIPRLSQIMAVADAFDAMTTNRIYKPRKEVRVALEELKALAGTHYDPEIVAAAVEALKEVTPPPVADQLPRTPIERQRFAYFFNDQLTRVHNRSYLQFLLQNGLPPSHKWAGMLMLRHFSRYNAEQGWSMGDKLLADFATYLAANYPDTLIFRVMGDDFLLLSPSPKDIDAERLKNRSPLKDTLVDVEVQEVDLSHGQEALQAII